MPGAMPCACDGWCSCAMVVPGRSDPNSLESWSNLWGSGSEVRIGRWRLPTKGTDTYPTLGSWENHGLKMPFLGGYVKHLGDYFLTFPTGKKTNESESPTYTRCIRSLKQVSPCKAADLNWYCWKKSFPQWIQRVSRFSSAIRFKYDHLICIYIYIFITGPSGESYLFSQQFCSVNQGAPVTFVLVHRDKFVKASGFLTWKGPLRSAL